MKKIFLCWVLALSFFLTSPGFAAENGSGKKIWPDRVKVGGEFRTRLEARFNDDLTDGTGGNDIFVLFRTRVYLDLNPNEIVRVFGMFQAAETVNQDDQSIFVTPDQVRFYQGFIDLKTPGDVTTRTRLGRQELKYGEERLIGAFNWGNLGRSFDGAVLRIENPDFWLDLFMTRIKLPNGKEAQLGSGYGRLKHFFEGILEPYVILYHGNSIGLNNGELSLVTLGTRITGNFKKSWDYDFEGAYQTGKSDGNLISAFALHGDFGHTFQIPQKPRLGFEANFASGDADPGNGTVTLFNNILPTNHNKYGYIDYFSWRNMIDLSPSFHFFPVSFMRAYIGYHAFFLPEPANGVFAASGKQFRAGAPGASSFAGQEIDLLLNFKPWKYFNALVGYSIFFPGNFFSDTGPSDTAQFFYAQFVAHY
jgi:hypothetical protein